MRGLGLTAIAILSSTADADPTEVDLLRAVPATVAVSSTVANAAIVPAHLVDGKLDTAWNSRTGDLVGAWIAVRIPADATVTALGLTVGFTKVDRKLGDLFTENVRIKRVKLSRDGVALGERTLDITKRDVQRLALPAGSRGGDYRIEVVEIEPGTKPAWREITVSELHVWGAPGATKATTSPVVRIGSLDDKRPSDALCIKAAFPAAKGTAIDADDQITDVDSIVLGDGAWACRITHAVHVVEEMTSAKHAIVVVRGKPVGTVELDTLQPTNTDGPAYGQKARVDVSAVALTAGEPALLVDVTEAASESGMPSELSMTKTTTTSTLYRVTDRGLVSVLDYSATHDPGASGTDTTCTLAVGAARKPLPDVDVSCVTTKNRLNKTATKQTTDHYRWDGTAYQPR